ncbi:hypothetical protein [Streptomyces formicae]|uniref:Uncharacterized protein n=1 Tax=Streptomyces formicae TaxID=1616117 RepID=A0A291QD65_9ACTN|nr:hypothetical protein [Streptomyces formicae]ATL29403.1 hypothetical protein KY5_4385c [Streptomyces formicae]
MALSIEDLKNMASTVIESTDGPTHLGSGQQVDMDSESQYGTNANVIDGDNHGSIRQSFGR